MAGVDAFTACQNLTWKNEFAYLRKDPNFRVTSRAPGTAATSFDNTCIRDDALPQIALKYHHARPGLTRRRAQGHIGPIIIRCGAFQAQLKDTWLDEQRICSTKKRKIKNFTQNWVKTCPVRGEYRCEHLHLH